MANGQTPNLYIEFENFRRFVYLDRYSANCRVVPTLLYYFAVIIIGNLELVYLPSVFRYRYGRCKRKESAIRRAC